MNQYRQKGRDLFAAGKDLNQAIIAGLGLVSMNARLITDGFQEAQAEAERRKGSVQRGMQAYADGKDPVQAVEGLLDTIEIELVTEGWHEANRNEQCRRMGVGGFGD